MDIHGPLEDLLMAQRDGPELLGAYARVRQRLFSSEFTRREPVGSGSMEPAPMRIGRYVVVETLGVGGMGMVVRAYDPKLGREVALKRVLDAELATARERMLLEAQAMAKLSHPNVVGVYDVEARTDDVVIVMEYVPGGDLQDWLRSPRDVAEILARFIDAGRGLAAAHRAGLVHRDFKPANVLLGGDGEVKVGDFGIAKSAGAPLPSSPGGTEGDAVKTAAGLVMGTPRYMAPEQASGREADARSDQFAFCVALWEALAESPPFEGDPAELVQAKHAGPPRWSSTHAVPGRCVDAMRRGLQPDPRQRFEDMDALLGALVPRPKGRWIVGGVVVAALGGALAFAAAPRSDVCSEDRELVRVGWSESERPVLLEHLEALPVPYASTLRDSAGRRLDSFLDRWLALHAEACRPGSQSRVEDNLALACLELGKAKWDATVRELSVIEQDDAARAMSLLEQLPDLDGCMDVKRLAAQGLHPANPQERRALHKLRTRVEEMHVVSKLGDFERAEALLDEAEALAGDDPLHHLIVREGRLGLLLARTDYDAAVDYAESLRADALREGAWAVAARTSNRLGALLVLVRGDEGRGLEISRTAVAEAVGAGVGPAELATAHANLGVGLLHAGLREEGIASLRSSVAVREEAGLDRTSNHAQTLGMLATALANEGAFDEARELLVRGHDLLDEELGPDHPRTLLMQTDTAVTLSVLGMRERAEALLRRSLASAEVTHGPNSRVALVARDNLGVVLSAGGRPEAAASLLSVGLERKRELFGPQHPQTRFSEVALAGAELRRGNPQAAVDALTPIVDGGDADGLMAHLLLGSALRELGRLEEAKTRLDRGLQIAQTEAGPGNELRVGLGVERARLSLQLDATEDARVRLEPLWAQVNVDHAPPKMVADVAEAYAEALDDPTEAAAVRRAGQAACRGLDVAAAPPCGRLTDSVPVGDRVEGVR